MSRSSFDHNAPAFAEDWRRQLAAVRAARGLTRTDAHGGFVVLGSKADVQRALRDQRTFASVRWFDPAVAPGGRTDGGVTIPPNPARMGMMEMDPPESVPYRRLLNPWFSRAAVDAYRPRVAEIVSWCIDGVIEAGTCDVVRDLGNPLAALVTLDVLGLPLERWRRYATLVHAAGAREPGSKKGVQWIHDDLAATVAAGELDGEGVVGALAGELPEAMVVELAYMLLNGGMDTTVATVGGMLAHLQSAPEDRQRLVADPTLVPTAVQELIRWWAPSTGVARTVTAPVEVRGEVLGAGERVFLALGSANLDVEAFDRPDEVLIDRQPNPHLSFGTGVHRCIGADLASAELELLLQATLTRLPDLEVDLARATPYPVMPLVNGFRTMPATFGPGRPLAGPRGDVPVLRRRRLRPPSVPEAGRQT